VIVFRRAVLIEQTERSALRNLILSAESKERILACEDIDQLQAWFRVIATAESRVDL